MKFYFTRGLFVSTLNHEENRSLSCRQAENSSEKHHEKHTCYRPGKHLMAKENNKADKSTYKS